MRNRARIHKRVSGENNIYSKRNNTETVAESILQLTTQFTCCRYADKYSCFLDGVSKQAACVNDEV